MKPKSREQFIKDADEKHGDKYDYSKVNYVNSTTKIIIICKVHDDFLQFPYVHLQGKGCKKCKNNKKCGRLIKTKDKFIEEATQKQGNKYDYSKVNYINSLTNIIIICKNHGEFLQIPSSHLRGQGCKHCCSNALSNTEKFTKNAIDIHGNKYDYLQVNYKNCDTKVKIRCTVHDHLFEQTPYNHLTQRDGCFKCAICNIRAIHAKSLTDFIKDAKKVHGDKYDYSKVKYINSLTKVIIICKKHNDFFQQPSQHLRGHQCPKCHPRYSKPQMEWLNLLADKLNLKIEHAENVGEYKIKNSRYEADGYCKELNLILEFQGCYYHGCKKCFSDRSAINEVSNKSFEELYNKTKQKRKHCIDQGYKYIQIWGCRWKKTYKKSHQITKIF